METKHDFYMGKLLNALISKAPIVSICTVFLCSPLSSVLTISWAKLNEPDSTIKFDILMSTAYSIRWYSKSYRMILNPVFG